MSSFKRLTSGGVARYFVFLMGILRLLSQTVLSMNEYVRVIKGNVNIRTAPSTQSMTVVSAKRGDTFELVADQGKWYEIQLFSGGQRFLHKSLAEPVSYRPTVPEDIEVRRRIFLEWAEAGTQARNEADRKYPPEKNVERNLSHGQLLEDRYRLELLQRHEVQPPAYRRILIEGYQKGW